MGPVPDPYELIGAQWPVDGPHSPDRLAAACQALAELVRYANHATASPGSAALRSAPEVYPAVRGLAEVSAGLVQLARQLSGFCAGLAVDPTLRHELDNGTDSGGSAPAAAQAGAEHLLRAAVRTDRVAESLRAATEVLGQLYHDPYPEW